MGLSTGPAVPLSCIWAVRAAQEQLEARSVPAFQREHQETFFPREIWKEVARSRDRAEDNLRNMNPLYRDLLK